VSAGGRAWPLPAPPRRALTRSSSPCTSLRVSAQMRSSAPITASPGCSRTSSAFPRAWSLRTGAIGGHMWVELGRRPGGSACPSHSHQWWWVVSTVVRDTPSRPAISSSWKGQELWRAGVSVGALSHTRAPNPACPASQAGQDPGWRRRESRQLLSA
jgi:hypothetical protein